MTTGLGATLLRAGRRLLSSLPALFGVLVFTFLLMRVLPGDPAVFFASGPNAGKEEIEQIRKQYRLDQPLPVQYGYWIKGVLSGDFGESLRIKMPVRDLILQKLPVTLQLGSMAILIAFCIGIPAGIVSAVKRARPGTTAPTCSRCGASRRRISGSASC